MSHFLSVALAVLLCTLALPKAHARWATAADADWVSEKQVREFKIRKDGTYTVTTENHIRILREGGRTLSNYRLTYNSRAARLKVLLAGTLNGAQRFEVESDFIEDKPLASRAQGFDQMNQVTIAFPKVSVGSVLHLKYREERKEVPFPGHFSSQFDIGVNWYAKDYEVRLISEMPLYLEQSDPQQKLEVSQEKKGEAEYLTTIRLKSPLYTRAVDEPWVSLSRKDLTWVLATSTREYPELAELLAERYEEVLSQPLPHQYRRIVEAARAKTEIVDQINTVTAELAAEVRYMGDWRPVRGGHVPRPLEGVATTKFGDCKDFAAATVAMLRALGLRAAVAWVERSLQPTPLPKLAFAGAFNHAIVFAESKDGRQWWVDPTNFASFAQGIFPDIVDRKALVVVPKASVVATIPRARPEDAVRSTTARIFLTRDGGAAIEAGLEYRGRTAAAYAGALLKQSKEHVDHSIITALVDENRLQWREIDEYDLRSRIASDFTLRVRWGERNYSTRTTVGPAFALEQGMFNYLIRLETRRRVSDLFMGHPDTVRNTDFYENVRALGRKVPECALDTPWVKVSRKVTQTSRGLRVEDLREVKRSLVTIEELRSPEFARFQERLQQCFDRVAVVYKPLQVDGARLPAALRRAERKSEAALPR